jgi:hypothetical protein
MDYPSVTEITESDLRSAAFVAYPYATNVIVYGSTVEVFHATRSRSFSAHAILDMAEVVTQSDGSSVPFVATA